MGLQRMVASISRNQKEEKVAHRGSAFPVGNVSEVREAI